MKSVRGLLLSVALGVVSTLLPVVLAIYLSWTTARNEEAGRLREMAGQVAERTQLAFREAADTLAAIQAAALEPCSPQHIGEMRRLTIDAPYIEEIGYTEDGVLRCTSWGMTQIVIRQRPFDFRTQEGLAVVANIAPVVSGGRPVMAVRLGVYNALVSPARIVDVLARPHLRVAAAHEDGTIIAARDEQSANLMRALFRDGFETRYAGLTVTIDRQGEWVVALAVPTAGARAAFMRQLLLFVPAGALMGGIAAFAVFRLSRKWLSPAGGLALAVRRREFIAYYQPIIDLRTGACVGAEALARWRMRDGAIVKPDMFLALAEETGLIRSITDQVVACACADLGAVLESDRGIHVAINFAAADMQTGRILDVLQTALAGTDIRPSQIWLEATERSFMELEAARGTIAQARSFGYVVMIDDFGTGFSSLQYLSHLPLDALKIDKSFIDTIGRETVTSSVTLYIIQMAKALNLFVVAEGVEKQEQANYLVEQGVQYAQGWFYAPPLPAEEFIAFLRPWNRRREQTPSREAAPLMN